MYTGRGTTVNSGVKVVEIYHDNWQRRTDKSSKNRNLLRHRLWTNLAFGATDWKGRNPYGSVLFTWYYVNAFNVRPGLPWGEQEEEKRSKPYFSCCFKIHHSSLVIWLFPEVIICFVYSTKTRKTCLSSSRSSTRRKAYKRPQNHPPFNLVSLDTCRVQSLGSQWRTNSLPQNPRNSWKGSIVLPVMLHCFMQVGSEIMKPNVYVGEGISKKIS